MEINIDDFKNCLGSFASGVTVITTSDQNNNPHGVTISAFSSLSLEPPLILFALSKTGFTYKHFANNSHFAANILSEEQSSISHKFAFEKENKWKDIDYKLSENSNPIINNTIAYIECEKYAEYEGGDHTIFIGKIINLKKLTNKKPLLYYGGKYHTLEELSRLS